MLPFLAGFGIKEWVHVHASALMWTSAFVIAAVVAFWDNLPALKSEIHKQRADPNTEAFVNPEIGNFDPGPSVCTVTAPSIPSVNRPGSVNDIPIETLKNSTSTFVDSVLSLCMKSLTSCSDKGFMEFTFVRMVKTYGFVEASAWAESLGIPHYHSATLFSALMYGPIKSTPGGHTRAANMTPEQRSEASRKAVQARWAKKKKP